MARFISPSIRPMQRWPVINKNILINSKEAVMADNINQFERYLRVIVGGGLLLWTLFFEGAVWGWLGVVPLATGLIGWCPVYSLFRK